MTIHANIVTLVVRKLNRSHTPHVVGAKWWAHNVGDRATVSNWIVGCEGWGFVNVETKSDRIIVTSHRGCRVLDLTDIAEIAECIADQVI